MGRTEGLRGSLVGGAWTSAREGRTFAVGEDRLGLGWGLGMHTGEEC